MQDKAIFHFFQQQLAFSVYLMASAQANWQCYLSAGVYGNLDQKPPPLTPY